MNKTTYVCEKCGILKIVSFDLGQSRPFIVVCESCGNSMKRTTGYEVITNNDDDMQRASFAANQMLYSGLISKDKIVF